MLLYAEPVRNKVLWVFIYVLIITIAEPLMIGILCLANMGIPTDFLEPGVARYLGMIGTKIIYLWLIALAHRIMKSRVVDSLVNIKAALAKTLGIEFICKVNIITELKADEMTLCRIIGNALDNAIEGCCRSDLPKKHICFSLNEKDEKIIMLITNTSDEVNIDDLVSTKKEKGVHGIGTESIRSSVESLNGIVDFNYEYGVFKLTLMVMNQ